MLANDVVDNSRVDIPFQVVNGLIIIEVEIDEKVGNYIFDTGAEELILNKKVESGNTLFSSINGELTTQEVNINLLKIGNLTQSKVKAYSTDLGSIESYLDIPIQGVIGCSLFLPNRVKIDFASNMITLSSNSDLIDHGESYVKFEMQDGVPVCPIEIDDKQYLFGFDTGATMHVLDQNIKRELQNVLQDTGLDTYVTTGTGEKTINTIQSIHAFELGDEEVEDAQFLLQDLSSFNADMEEPISGVLSLIALGLDEIVIDLHDNRIYF